VFKDNSKAPIVSVSAMIIYSKMSLHAFGRGSTNYSTIYGEVIKNYRSQTNSNNLVMIPNFRLLNDTDIIGASQAEITNIVSSYVNNKLSIGPLNGAKPNEPRWALLPIHPTLIFTMHL
jgi:hypothetical protein